MIPALRAAHPESPPKISLLPVRGTTACHLHPEVDLLNFQHVSVLARRGEASREALEYSKLGYIILLRKRPLRPLEKVAFTFGLLFCR